MAAVELNEDKQSLIIPLCEIICLKTFGRSDTNEEIHSDSQVNERSIVSRCRERSGGRETAQGEQSVDV